MIPSLEQSTHQQFGGKGSLCGVLAQAEETPMSASLHNFSEVRGDTRAGVPGSNKVAEFFGELIARQGGWVVVDYGVVQVEELHHLVKGRSMGE